MSGVRPCVPAINTPTGPVHVPTACAPVLPITHRVQGPSLHMSAHTHVCPSPHAGAGTAPPTGPSCPPPVPVIKLWPTARPARCCGCSHTTAAATEPKISPSPSTDPGDTPQRQRQAFASSLIIVKLIPRGQESFEERSGVSVPRGDQARLHRPPGPCLQPHPLPSPHSERLANGNTGPHSEKLLLALAKQKPAETAFS